MHELPTCGGRERDPCQGDGSGFGEMQRAAKVDHCLPQAALRWPAGWSLLALVLGQLLLGWSPGGDREQFDREFLITNFSLDRIVKSPATRPSKEARTRSSASGGSSEAASASLKSSRANLRPRA